MNTISIKTCLTDTLINVSSALSRITKPLMEYIQEFVLSAVRAFRLQEAKLSEAEDSPAQESVTLIGYVNYWMKSLKIRLLTRRFIGGFIRILARLVNASTVALKTMNGISGRIRAASTSKTFQTGNNFARSVTISTIISQLRLGRLGRNYMVMDSRTRSRPF